MPGFCLVKLFSNNTGFLQKRSSNGLGEVDYCRFVIDDDCLYISTGETYDEKQPKRKFSGLDGIRVCNRNGHTFYCVSNNDC